MVQSVTESGCVIKDLANRIDTCHVTRLSHLVASTIEASSRTIHPSIISISIGSPINQSINKNIC